MTGIIFIDCLYQFLLKYELEFALILTIFVICIWAAISEKE